jgi:hypothetical protein
MSSSKMGTYSGRSFGTALWKGREACRTREQDDPQIYIMLALATFSIVFRMGYTCPQLRQVRAPPPPWGQSFAKWPA